MSLPCLESHGAAEVWQRVQFQGLRVRSADLAVWTRGEGIDQLPGKSPRFYEERPWNTKKIHGFFIAMLDHRRVCTCIQDIKGIYHSYHGSATQACSEMLHRLDMRLDRDCLCTTDTPQSCLFVLLSRALTVAQTIQICAKGTHVRITHTYANIDAIYFVRMVFRYAWHWHQLGCGHTLGNARSTMIVMNHPKCYHGHVFFAPTLDGSVRMYLPLLQWCQVTTQSLFFPHNHTCGCGLPPTIQKMGRSTPLKRSPS